MAKKAEESKAPEAPTATAVTKEDLANFTLPVMHHLSEIHIAINNPTIDRTQIRHALHAIEEALIRFTKQQNIEDKAPAAPVLVDGDGNPFPLPKHPNT